MHAIGCLTGAALILFILIDCFETILQPRRVTHRFRYARFYYRNTWKLWRAVARALPVMKVRESFLSVFGPLSLLGLFGTWVVGLILGFALIQWSLGSLVHGPDVRITLGTYCYLSGTTFFTLGYGDVTPVSTLGRILAVTESGLGFGFLAVVVSYLPILWQAFSNREVTISLLDARAGSPPSAAQVLVRLARSGNMPAADAFLAEWERWAATLLESQLSFPVLSYFRSQHDNQSWLAALTVMLDTSAVLLAAAKDRNPYQTQLTFAMARHAAVDLALIHKTRPMRIEMNRLPANQLSRLWATLRQAGVPLNQGQAVDEKLSELRSMYEPFLEALARRFLFPLPRFVPDEGVADNWQRSAWMHRTAGLGGLPLVRVDTDHFE